MTAYEAGQVASAVTASRKDRYATTMEPPLVSVLEDVVDAAVDGFRSVEVEVHDDYVDAVERGLKERGYGVVRHPEAGDGESVSVLSVSW